MSLSLDDLARAAVAIANEYDPEGLHLSWGDLSDADKNQSRAEARAVVAALLEELARQQNEHECYDEFECKCEHQILQDFKTLLRSAIEEGETT